MSGPDPFASTADPAAYVPRTATEGVLVRLEMALREGARVICLGGPAGSGKTLLLRVLEERIAGDFEAIHVAYPNLAPDEFCEWALVELDAFERASDPEQALAARIARGAASGHPPLVWLIDDADSMPSETLLRLLRLQKRAGDAMRTVFVRANDRPLVELAMANLPSVDITLEGEMGSAEMAHYVRARLDYAGADPHQRAQLEGELDALYACSHGNPARLHAAAAALLCFGPDSLRTLREEAPEDAPQTGTVIELEPSEIAPEAIEVIELVDEAIAVSPGPEPDLDLEVEIETARQLGLEIEPESEQEHEPESEPVTEPAPSRAPRKRHRLRRLGRR
jgi:type II secretory pathway predicted ATPase ExeA